MAVVPLAVEGVSICGANVGSCSVVYSDSSRQDLGQFHGIIGLYTWLHGPRTWFSEDSLYDPTSSWLIFKIFM